MSLGLGRPTPRGRPRRRRGPGPDHLAVLWPAAGRRTASPLVVGRPPDERRCGGRHRPRRRASAPGRGIPGPPPGPLQLAVVAFDSEARHRLQPLLLQAQAEGRRLLDLPHLLEPGRFGEDNRAGIESTLHRISAIRNSTGDVVGLTCRVGRAVFGTVTMVRDLLNASHLFHLKTPVEPETVAT